MSKRSDDFRVTVVRTLRERVNGRCSNPDCHRATVGPSKERPDKSTITGEAAHIKAASATGPRYDATQSSEERRSIENGIWLCSACADLIDKNDGVDYSVQTLFSWKRRAEAKAAHVQAKPTQAVEAEWDSGFAAISYMNIPRLGMLTAGRGGRQLPSQLKGVTKLHELGISLVHLMYEVEQTMRFLSVKAIPLEHAVRLDEDFTGATVSFDSQCFTKNGPEVPDGSAMPPIPADWNKAPHIYCKNQGWKIVMVYDPKWVTTTTAYCDFRGGNRRFKGICIVKEVDRKNRLVIASPLLLGLPKPDFEF